MFSFFEEKMKIGQISAWGLRLVLLDMRGMLVLREERYKGFMLVPSFTCT